MCICRSQNMPRRGSIAANWAERTLKSRRVTKNAGALEKRPQKKKKKNKRRNIKTTWDKSSAKEINKNQIQHSAQCSALLGAGPVQETRKAAANEANFGAQSHSFWMPLADGVDDSLACNWNWNWNWRTWSFFVASSQSVYSWPIAQQRSVKWLLWRIYGHEAIN